MITIKKNCNRLWNQIDFVTMSFDYCFENSSIIQKNTYVMVYFSLSGDAFEKKNT